MENWKDEIKSVKQLGEQIGYGNMIDIAQTLWSIMLEDEHKIETFPIASCLPSDMKKKYEQEFINKISERKKQVRELLGS